MSIKAIAKKRIGLRADGNIIMLEPLAYTELPETVQADPMFAWAKQDGTLQVLGDDEPKKQKAVKKTVPEAVSTEQVK